MPTADTTAEAAKAQRSAIASKEPSERTAMAFEMSELMYQIIVDGIRRREPNLAPEQLSLRLIERLHGPALARTVAASSALARAS